MPWYSPPTRREVALVLFALTTFVLFYNLETSFTAKGKHEASLNEVPDKYWDNEIYGYSGWAAHEHEVAENAQKNALKHAKETQPFDPYVFGSVGVNDGIQDWGDQLPTTTVLKHVPGHTILDNVFVLNGTVFVVTDDPSFPALDAIASSSEDSHAVLRNADWQILSTAKAKETLGSFGGLIHGVTWLVTDVSPSNYTLFSLWRTYTELDRLLSPGNLTLPPPRRVFYPRVRALLGEKPTTDGPIPPRERTPSGFHPFSVKAAFPTLGLLYADDWADYALLHVPFLFQRVVVADQGAARRGRGDVPPFAVPLVAFEPSVGWWEPIRRGVARFVGVPEEVAREGAPGIVVTYLTHQDAVSGPRLRHVDHEALARALGELGDGYRVHVVSTEGPWMERVRAIAQSTVVIGVHGSHMADCVYVPPAARATVMEAFPPGVFVRDLQMAISAVGTRYVSWRDGKQHPVNALPPDSPASNDTAVVEVSLDVDALIQAIRDIV